MSVATPHLVEAARALHDVVGDDAPMVSTAGEAAELIDAVEHVRRLAAIASVDALHQIETTRSFYDHGHANARVMFAHLAGASPGDTARLDKIRRMVTAADEIALAWGKAELSTDKAALLARAFANPRSRARFLIDQRWFLKQAARFSFKRLQKIVARWLEVHDTDGTEPAPDPSFENRNLSLVQDHFSKAWKLDGSLGSLQGSLINEALAAYTEAEFLHDWATAEQIHGPDTHRDQLARTDTQRRADALCQLIADAINSDKPSAPVKRVHNIVWTAETYEALLDRWATGAATVVDPDKHRVTDIDGNPIESAAAFVDSLTGLVRRVVANAAGVTINMSSAVRLFTGLTRLGVEIVADECYWPGCHVPTSRCQIDHLKPAARGGPTDQLNGCPACKRHNRFKQRGYTVTRQPDGTITVATPTGEIIQ